MIVEILKKNRDGQLKQICVLFVFSFLEIAVEDL